MTNETHFFIKINFSFYSRKGPTVVVSLDINGETYTQGEDFFFPYFLPGSRGERTLAPPCKLVRDDLIGCVSHAWLWFSALCLNLTAWFSSRGLLPITHLLYPSALIVLPCLLITTWQLVKAHGVTRNEPKIHGVCYITLSQIYSPKLQNWSLNTHLTSYC